MSATSLRLPESVVRDQMASLESPRASSRGSALSRGSVAAPNQRCRHRYAEGSTSSATEAPLVDSPRRARARGICVRATLAATGASGAAMTTRRPVPTLQRRNGPRHASMPSLPTSCSMSAIPPCAIQLVISSAACAIAVPACAVRLVAACVGPGTLAVCVAGSPSAATLAAAGRVSLKLGDMDSEAAAAGPVVTATVTRTSDGSLAPATARLSTAGSIASFTPSCSPKVVVRPPRLAC